MVELELNIEGDQGQSYNNLYCENAWRKILVREVDLLYKFSTKSQI